MRATSLAYAPAALRSAAPFLLHLLATVSLLGACGGDSAPASPAGSGGTGGATGGRGGGFGPGGSGGGGAAGSGVAGGGAGGSGGASVGGASGGGGGAGGSGGAAGASGSGGTGGSSGGGGAGGTGGGAGSGGVGGIGGSGGVAGRGGIGGGGSGGGGTGGGGAGGRGGGGGAATCGSVGAPSSSLAVTVNGATIDFSNAAVSFVSPSGARDRTVLLEKNDVQIRVSFDPTVATACPVVRTLPASGLGALVRGADGGAGGAIYYSFIAGSSGTFTIHGYNIGGTMNLSEISFSCADCLLGEMRPGADDAGAPTTLRLHGEAHLAAP